MAGRIITGSLVGAIVLFLVGFMWYGVLPIGSSPWQPMPNQSAIVVAMKAGEMTSGTYVFPYMERDGDATSMEEWQTSHANGPLIEVRYRAEGVAVPDPGMMINGLIHFFVSALIVAILMRMALPMLVSYGKRLGFVMLLGTFVGVFAQLSGPIWMYYPWDRAMLDTVYNILSWSLAGAAMAAIIKPAAAAAVRVTERPTVTAVN